jgi:hypothetical protein
VAGQSGDDRAGSEHVRAGGDPVSRGRTGRRRLTCRPVLVDAFGWTSKDLRRVARAANHSLRGTGLHVHIANSGLALHAEEMPVRKVIASVERLRARDDSMDNGTARVLYEVVTGSIAQGQIEKGYGPRLGYLSNQGMVHVGRPGEKFIVPSEDVAVAFDV